MNIRHGWEVPYQWAFKWENHRTNWALFPGFYLDDTGSIGLDGDMIWFFVIYMDPDTSQVSVVH